MLWGLLRRFNTHLSTHVICMESQQRQNNVPRRSTPIYICYFFWPCGTLLFSSSAVNLRFQFNYAKCRLSWPLPLLASWWIWSGLPTKSAFVDYSTLRRFKVVPYSSYEYYACVFTCVVLCSIPRHDPVYDHLGAQTLRTGGFRGQYIEYCSERTWYVDVVCLLYTQGRLSPMKASCVDWSPQLLWDTM